MERVKPMQRNASLAASAADADVPRPELVAEEEPRYLRRQKPVEIRRKRLTGRSWSFYRSLFLWSLLGIALIVALTFTVRFLYSSPQMLLLKPDQIDVTGNHIVSNEDVLKIFLRDRGKSAVSVPLDTRRSEIQELPWVEDARVQRILPNRLRVDITERTPIAFIRVGNELALIDSHGVILARPAGEDFHFPIVTGLAEDMPREEREHRMQTYQEFLKSIELVHHGASETVSEIDLSNRKNLVAVLTGLGGSTDAGAVTVRFGQNDFSNKYSRLLSEFPKWLASVGPVHSVDLQFSRQAVVNPDTSAQAAKDK